MALSRWVQWLGFGACLCSAVWAGEVAAAEPGDLKQSHPPVVDAVNHDLSGFSEEVEKIRGDWKVQGLAIAIVKGDQVLFSKGFGWRDNERKLPMTADTIMPIGSVTKAFTTATIASLVEEGRLAWELPVKTWLPTFKLQDPIASENVTLLDMALHRSGLPRHDVMTYSSVHMPLADLTRRLQYLEPSKPFRSTFQYNNSVYAVAGYIAEVVTGKSWEQNVRDRIFEPLGMRRSTFTWEQTLRDSNYAMPYKRQSDGSVTLTPYRPIYQIGPAGTISSSVNEMVPWLQLHLRQRIASGKQLLSAKSVEFLHTPQVVNDEDVTSEVVPTGYAPGWYTDVYRGHRRVSHDGLIQGYSAVVLLYPDAGIGVVVLANTFDAAAHHYVARTAADRLLHLPRVDWSGRALERMAKGEMHDHDAAGPPEERHSGTQPSHPMEDYVGEFEHPAYGVMKVSLEGGQLSFIYNEVQTALEHWHYDVFNGLQAKVRLFRDQKLQFFADVTGAVDTLQMNLEAGVKDIVFTRVPEARMKTPAFLQTMVGSYRLAGESLDFHVKLQGNGLVVDVPSQETYVLEPKQGTRFALKGHRGFYMEFGSATNAQFQQLKVIQPTQTVVAQRQP